MSAIAAHEGDSVDGRIIPECIPSARANSVDKVCAMAGDAADDAAAMRNLLRLVRGREAGFAVCAAMRCSMLASL